MSDKKRNRGEGYVLESKTTIQSAENNKCLNEFSLKRLLHLESKWLCMSKI